jgi:hypothetical protein
MSNILLEVARDVRDKREYIEQNLKPCIEQFLNHVEYNDPHTGVAERGWSWCDMIFTAFICSGSMQFIDKNHELYIWRIQVWYRALCRAEGQILDQHIPSRVRNAETILEGVEKTRQTRPDPFNIFDQMVFEKGKVCNKKYKLFCLCLSYIVQQDHNAFKIYSHEWETTVVCGWFDEDNTEDAREFVMRAEAFFHRNISVTMLSEYAKLGRAFLENRASHRAAASRRAASDRAAVNEYLVEHAGGHSELEQLAKARKRLLELLDENTACVARARTSRQ